MKLFHLAQKAEDLDRLTFFTGRAALNDDNLMRTLIYAEQSATAPDKSQMKQLLSEENKLRVQRIAEAVKERG